MLKKDSEGYGCMIFLLGTVGLIAAQLLIGLIFGSSENRDQDSFNNYVGMLRIGLIAIVVFFIYLKIREKNQKK